MLKNIMCGIAVLLGLALFLVDSQLASYGGMVLIGLGLFPLGGSASEVDSEDGSDQISPADRVRRLQDKQNAV